MNKVIISGNVCAKPEAYKTQSGISRSMFKIAVQRRYRNEAGNYDADFLPVIAWRQTADFCNQYIDKGRKVLIEGCIQTRSYDAQDGSKRYVTEIIADHVETLDKSSDAQQKPVVAQNPATTPDGFTEVDDDRLPF